MMNCSVWRAGCFQQFAPYFYRLARVGGVFQEHHHGVAGSVRWGYAQEPGVRCLFFACDGGSIVRGNAAPVLVFGLRPGREQFVRHVRRENDAAFSGAGTFLPISRRSVRRVLNAEILSSSTASISRSS